MSTEIQTVMPFNYDAMVETMIVGGRNLGVTATPKQDVITASAGQTTNGGGPTGVLIDCPARVVPVFSVLGPQVYGTRS